MRRNKLQVDRKIYLKKCIKDTIRTYLPNIPPVESFLTNEESHQILSKISMRVYATRGRGGG